MIEKDRLVAAQKFVARVAHNTPILTSSFINGLANAELFFKCENFQKVGAFKYRGASWALENLTQEQLKKGVTTHSSGNHGQAVAKAASAKGVLAYIVMPETAPTVKINAVKDYGAQVFLCPPTLTDREQFMKKIVSEKGATPIHPYNDYWVIEGQSTCAQEFFVQVPNLQIMITPVGGGGLLAGTILARNYFSPNTCVIAGEPIGANDTFLSITNQKLTPIENPSSIADGLIATIGKKNFEIIKDGVQRIITVSEEEIISAMKLIWERMKIIVEPSCAVALAAVLKEKEEFKGKRIGVILTGGNVELAKVLKLF